MLGTTNVTRFVGQLIELMCEAQVRAWITLEQVRGMFVRNGHIMRGHSAAQTLVEYSIVAAVMALIGITAWQAVGTAITDAINRAVSSLTQAGG
jgi:Flp pilus assembly pilin Flp